MIDDAAPCEFSDWEHLTVGRGTATVISQGHQCIQYTCDPLLQVNPWLWRESLSSARNFLMYVFDSPQ